MLFIHDIKTKYWQLCIKQQKIEIFQNHEKKCENFKLNITYIHFAVFIY